jgi:hypothetical protein
MAMPLAFAFQRGPQMASIKKDDESIAGESGDLLGGSVSHNP